MPLLSVMHSFKRTHKHIHICVCWYNGERLQQPVCQVCRTRCAASGQNVGNLQNALCITAAMFIRTMYVYISMFLCEFLCVCVHLRRCYRQVLWI